MADRDASSRRRRQLRLAGPVALAGLLAASCGNLGSTPAVGVPSPALATVAVTTPPSESPTSSAAFPTTPDLPPGLLAIAGNGVAFLQGTRTGDAISGSITQVLVIDPASHLPQNEAIDFTGTMSGDSVTLTLVGGQTFGRSSYLTGHYRNGQLTLTYPAADGTIATIVFLPGTVSDYNAAVESFDSAQAALLQAQQRADAEAAASAAAEAAGMSCSTRVAGHDAIALVTGPESMTECLRIASQVTFSDGSSWAAPQAPSDGLPAGDTVVCGGLIGSLRVVIYDSGGQSYAGQACNAVPLVVAFIGIGNWEPAAGGLRLISGQDANGNATPAIVPGSPAARADLREGDIITAIDGAPVSTVVDLTTILAYDSPKQRVELTILRDASLVTVALTLAVRPN